MSTKLKNHFSLLLIAILMLITVKGDDTIYRTKLVEIAAGKLDEELPKYKNLLLFFMTSWW